MSGLKLLLNKASNEEREGLQRILGSENATPAAIVRSLTWNYVSLVWSSLGSDPTYEDIARHVADNLEAPYDLYDRVEEIEIAIAKKVMKTVWERMTPKQRREMEEEWQKIGREFDESWSLAGNTSILGAFAADGLSGFETHLLATTALGSLKGVKEIALPFTVYAAMGRVIAVVIGPAGWIGAGLFSLWKLCGANYKRLIPAILYICALRSHHEAAASQSSDSGSYTCSVCGKELGTNLAAGQRYCNECLPLSNTEGHIEDRKEDAMRWSCEENVLEPAEIKERWEIQNPLLASLLSQGVEYRIQSDPAVRHIRNAVFYLHGFSADFGACSPDLEDAICPHAPLVRVSCYGLTGGSWDYPKLGPATFGDICAMLYNGRQSIYSIADKLELESYSIVAHSWGGFSACLAAFNDVRCDKAMLLTSSPDICDVFCRLPVPWIASEAEQAKFGSSSYQDAWDAISPYGRVSNSGVDLLIFNRDEDPVMRPWNVKHFIEHAENRGIVGINAEFNSYPDLPNGHEMPPAKFIKRMKGFLFGDELAEERLL